MLLWIHIKSFTMGTEVVCCEQCCSVVEMLVSSDTLISIILGKYTEVRLLDPMVTLV